MGMTSGISNKYCGCAINLKDDSTYCLCCEDSKCVLRHMLELLPRLFVTELDALKAEIDVLHAKEHKDDEED